MSAQLDEPRWLSDGEQQSWRAYLRGSRFLEEALDRDLQAHGLQLTEYEILSMLSESDGGRLRMSELADLVVQSRSRLTHTAARLEKRGWVERQSCLSDRRGVELVLTDEGWERLNTMARTHVESVRKHLLDVMGAGRVRRPRRGDGQGARRRARRYTRPSWPRRVPRPSCKKTSSPGSTSWPGSRQA